MALNDEQIRPALRHWIRETRGIRLVLDEVPLREGRSFADLMALSEKIHLFEIKGQTDKLDRLKNQVRWFNAIGHHCSIVTTANHLRALSRYIPSWWEVIVAGRGDGAGVVFEVHHPGTPNPERQFLSMLLCLWKQEMLDILRARGRKAADKWSKGILALRLHALFGDDVDTLAKELVYRLKLRTEDEEWHSIHVK